MLSPDKGSSQSATKVGTGRKMAASSLDSRLVKVMGRLHWNVEEVPSRPVALVKLSPLLIANGFNAKTKLARILNFSY